MQCETFILKSLFAACLLICVLTFGAMVTAKPTVPHMTAAPSHAMHAASAT